MKAELFFSQFPCKASFKVPQLSSFQSKSSSSKFCLQCLRMRNPASGHRTRNRSRTASPQQTIIILKECGVESDSSDDSIEGE
jgi:hypothetical protein